MGWRKSTIEMFSPAVSLSMSSFGVMRAILTPKLHHGLFSLIRPEHREYHEAQHYRVDAFVEKPNCRLGLSLLRAGHEVDS